MRGYLRVGALSGASCFRVSQVPHPVWALPVFVGGILAYGAAFAGYLLVNFDVLDLLRDVGDDAFYYFQIAYHLAEGRFSTFDGGITRTNGYHPFWLLLITPFYWMFDKEGALFAIKALEIMLIAGGVALIAVAARLARLPYYLLFALLPILYQQRGLLLGLEAAAALFMLGLLFLALLLYARNPERWRWTWPLAVVAFALPWVRLEYIAISLTATAALLLMEWLRREPTPGASWRAALTSIPTRRAFAPIISAVAGLLTYFAYNKLVFGGIVPVSGATKRAWSQIRFEEEGGYRLFQNFQAVRQIDVFNNETLLTALAICAGFLLVGWLAGRSRSREDWLLLAFLAGGFSLAVGHLAKFAQTVLQVHPNWGGYTWYFAPAYLMLALVIPVGCYVAIHLLRRFIGPRSARVSNVSSVVILVVGAVLLFTKADFAGPFRYVEEHSQSTQWGWGVATYMGMQVVNGALAEDNVIGSWDAGAVGYFSRFPVVSLDGLVNSYAYFHGLVNSYAYFHAETYVDRDSRATWQADIYRELGITHLANLRPTSHSEDTILFEGPPFFTVRKTELQFMLWSVEPTEGADPAAWFWQRMEPSLDAQGDGVGLVVDGRVVQAFARGCPPGEQAVWSWAGPGDGTAAKAWTQTQTGLCVDARVLPHNALPPVRVETMSASDWVAGALGRGQPVIRSDWDVYLVEDSLIYVRDPCSPEDVEPEFFLHVDPVDVNDLPDHRKQYGFDGFNFDFRNHLLIEGGDCVARRELPDYAYGIAAVRTGQFSGDGQIWNGGFDLAGVGGRREGKAVP